jgi:hypothetical protein
VVGLWAVGLLSWWNVCALVLGIFARYVEAFMRGACMCDPQPLSVPVH